MGKKAKSQAKLAKKAEKQAHEELLTPPPPPQEQIGSRKPVEKPSVLGNNLKLLEQDGYDDGGVADLALLVDLQDEVLRRKRGEVEYFHAIENDRLPRARRGPLSESDRRSQKVNLAQLLFSENDECEDKGPEEIYLDHRGGNDDPPFMKQREQKLARAKASLRLSLLLREPASASLSLSELCKRRLAFYGKDGAEDSLRCADKAIEIAGDGFWDGDDIAVEADDNVVIDPRYEKNATTPGLSHPTSLKFISPRVSLLCLRSAHLQRGNALAALGKEIKSRESYLKILPFIESEPRCSRTDWERHSLYINIGNTFCRSGDIENAEPYYKKADQLGLDHLNAVGIGSEVDGNGMVLAAKRARAFALQKVGKIDLAKELLAEVIGDQRKLDLLEKRKKAEIEELLEKNVS